MTGWRLLPPRPDVCQVCAVEHDELEPHNRDSLYYQYRFYFQHDRWPTWGDALAHCEPHVQAYWRSALAAKGVPAEQLEPSAT